MTFIDTPWTSKRLRSLSHSRCIFFSVLIAASCPPCQRIENDDMSAEKLVFPVLYCAH